MMLIKTILATMAFQYIGTPYKWGGNSYNGMDCSGFVLKSLHDVGMTLPDMTSQSLYRWALSNENFYSCEPSEDCLLFFGTNDQNIKHVSISLNEEYMIESGGSGRESLVMSNDDLARIDARVRIKPINNRKDLLHSIKIIY